MRFTAALTALLALAGVPSGVRAARVPQGTRQSQAPAISPGVMSVEERAALTQGWKLLAEGHFDDAQTYVAQMLERFPRDVSVASLAVEVAIARTGALAALGVYERWAGGLPTEDAFVLRQVARATLHEWARQTGDGEARSDALRALADDGDQEAQAELVRGANAGQFNDVRVLAATGNDQAQQMLVKRLAQPGSKINEIKALMNGKVTSSRSALAGVLSDPIELNRGLAAEALGRLGDAQDIPKLKPMLNDPAVYVRQAAAGALYRLNDTSGLAMLQELAQSSDPGVRIGAAGLLASHPDEQWQALVRSLAADPNPQVRLQAAQMIAPYDSDLARQVLNGLLNDPNIAYREEAGRALGGELARDLPTLRQLLRSSDGLTRVKAADRILSLTR